VTRVAAVDLGTNTTRLLVAEVDDGRVDEIVRRETITRLGEGVDARRRLLPLPIARVRNVLADYRRELEALGAERVLAVATSAVRDAENGEAFLGEVERSYGFATQLLSGEDEAALTLRGVGEVDDETLVLDVGGGSTELIMRDDWTSLDIGSGRLTEQFGEDVDAIARRVQEVLRSDLHPTRMIGVGGTITALSRCQAPGHVLSVHVVREQVDRLAALSLDERRALHWLDPERAPVIVAGATIVREVMAYFGIEQLDVSERDLLDGAALAAAELPEPVEGDAPPGAYTCC
jgi:exopolyphosphatase/guanosine-5'-triphosphate,3'-diphosphate pyrophosphatase